MGQGEPEAFILRMTFVIWWYEGGDKSYGFEGSASGGIQSGILKHFEGFMGRKKSWKYLVQAEISKEGEDEVLLLKYDLT